jgi:hypothetical protein
MAAIIRSLWLEEDGVVDEFIGMMGAFFATMVLILASVPITGMIQSVSTVNSAVRLAAQSALPYAFPLQAGQAEQESNAVFQARTEGENVSCAPLAISTPRSSGGYYSVSATCNVVPLGVRAASFSITVHSSVKTSIYQGA